MSEHASALPTADRAFVLALEGWQVTPDETLWNTFDTALRNALEAACMRIEGDQAGPALETLRREHAAQIRPDLLHVHPTWLLRGLSGESPAIQRAAVMAAPFPLRDVLRRGLSLTESDLKPDLTPQHDALNWVATLWLERLVGDVAERDDDPPAIRALTRGTPRSVLRLIRMAGLVKWAGSRAAAPRLAPRQVQWFNASRSALSEIGDRFRDLADRDLAAVRRNTRHALSRLGAPTVARLLSLADPYRVRWALQHMPYATAKFVRSIMPPKPQGTPSWVMWEGRVLELAGERLQTAGPWSADEGDTSA